MIKQLLLALALAPVGQLVAATADDQPGSMPQRKTLEINNKTNMQALCYATLYNRTKNIHDTITIAIPHESTTQHEVDTEEIVTFSALFIQSKIVWQGRTPTASVDLIGDSKRILKQGSLYKIKINSVRKIVPPSTHFQDTVDISAKTT